MLKTAAGGVLIYLMSGQFSVAGGANVTLTSESSGTYKGIALWQAAADTQAVSFSNGGALVFNGAIYAPKAQLNITGNAQTPTVTSLVVGTVALSNSGGITVGTPSSPGLSISGPASLPAWAVNQPGYSATITGAGGDGHYSWAVTSGALPAGLSLSSSTGVISGKPTATGSPSVTITLSDALGDTVATKTYTLTVNAAPTITSMTPSTHTKNITGLSVVIKGTGFQSGAAVQLNATAGTAPTITNTTWNSSTQITITITVPNATSTDNVVVNNPDSGTATSVGGFTAT